VSITSASIVNTLVVFIFLKNVANMVSTFSRAFLAFALSASRRGVWGVQRYQNGSLVRTSLTWSFTWLLSSLIHNMMMMMMCNDLMYTYKLTRSQLSLAHDVKVKPIMPEETAVGTMESVRLVKQLTTFIFVNIRLVFQFIRNSPIIFPSFIVRHVTVNCFVNWFQFIYPISNIEAKNLSFYMITEYLTTQTRDVPTLIFDAGESAGFLSVRGECRC